MCHEDTPVQAPHFAEKEILSPLLPDPLFHCSALKLMPQAEIWGGNSVDSFPSSCFSSAQLRASRLLRGCPWWLRWWRTCLWCGRPGSIPAEGNGYPFQYSRPENSTDRGTWQAIVHGVTVLDTIKWKMFFFHFSSGSQKYSVNLLTS